jgi:hypothetical protein
MKAPGCDLKAPGCDLTVQGGCGHDRGDDERVDR